MDRLIFELTVTRFGAQPAVTAAASQAVIGAVAAGCGAVVHWQRRSDRTRSFTANGYVLPPTGRVHRSPLAAVPQR